MSRVEKTLKNATWGMISKILNILIVFGSRTVFIYVLGNEYLGVSSLFTSILTMLSLAELGFAEAITYSLYKPIAENDSEKISAIMKLFKKVYTWVGIIILVLGLLIVPWLGNLVKEVPNIKENITTIYILYLINSAISYFYVYKSILLEASQQKYMISIVNTIVCLVKTMLNCILLVIMKNFVIYLIIEIVGTLSYNILISQIAQKKYPTILGKNNSNLTTPEKKSIFKNVKAMFFYKVSGVVLTSTDNIIINSFINTVAVGIYSNYVLITTQVYNIILQIFNATTASIGNLVASESKERQYTVFNNMMFFSFTIYCICTTMLWVLINPFIQFVWGTQYLLPTGTVAIILVNFYLTGMLTILASFRTTNGLFVQGQYRPIMMAIINVVVSLALVNVMGLNGVILGTIIARLCTQIWYDPYLVYKNVFHKKVREYFKINIKYSILIILCCVLGSVIANYINIPNGMLELILKAMISLAIPVTMISVLFHQTESFHYFWNIIKVYFDKIRKKLKKR